jgi:hemolysin III
MPVPEIERLNTIDDGDTAFAVITRGLKPKLRGIPDVIATLFALPAAAFLIVYARAGLPTVAAAVYGVSLVLLFAISATYHTPHWPLNVRRVWRRLDHSAIYLLIAGSYTPVTLIIVPESSNWFMPLLGAVTLAGLAKSFLWERSPRWLNTMIYIVLGYLILPFVPAMYERTGTVGVQLWAVGGALYSIGAIVYVRRKPNPWPAVFGYHEIFHVFVVGAGVLHFIAFWRLLV